MLASVKKLSLRPRGDARGQLIALESLSEQIPFEIKRVFYIYDTTPGTVRGKHAHHTMRQVLICISGSCTIRCDLGNGHVTDYELNWPDQGLLIEGMVWHDMLNFSKDAVLLVLASEHYNESDYIRKYEDFTREVQEDAKRN